MNQVLSAPREVQRGPRMVVRRILNFLRCALHLKRTIIAPFEKEIASLREEARLQACELERCDSARRRSDRSVRLLADQLTELVWIMDPAGQAEFFNRRWRSYTGLRGADTKQEGWRTILHPGDLQRFFASWVMAYAAGCPYRAEFRLKPVDGADYRWCSVHVFPQRDPTDKIERWIGVVFTGNEVVDDTSFGAPPR